VYLMILPSYPLEESFVIEVFDLCPNGPRFDCSCSACVSEIRSSIGAFRFGRTLCDSRFLTYTAYRLPWLCPNILLVYECCPTHSQYGAVCPFGYYIGFAALGYYFFKLDLSLP